ncbi:MAG: hypothetical protein SAJ12_10220 [Jaaginema sp. PMC 1079.18]|nr:hypothetical protein [Jaaginema sp. PMC 1080.18]MEC4851375.1 hypothetical protein [Jaaginema sp. PMC 1079.18]MEC4868815.1 hypothetical protein [Jaaginema sp. PMC 1078.18]
MQFAPHRLWAVGIGMLVATALPGATIAQEMPDLESLNGDRGTPYPDFVQSQWMSICTNTEGAALQPFCRCMLDEFQANYSLQEFVELGLQLNSGGETPEKLNQISEYCAVSYPE